MNWRPLASIFSMAAAIFLMQLGHEYLAGLFIAVTVFCIIDNSRFQYESELKWISESLIYPSKLEDIKIESSLYNYFNNLIDEKLIKKGMALEDLRAVLKEHMDFPAIVPGLNHAKFKEALNSMFINYEFPQRVFTIILRGYGSRVPPPKLVLKIEKNKILGWKSDRWT